jgi:hypothetical protein
MSSVFEPYQVRDALLQKEASIANNNVTEYIDLGELTERGARLEIYELGLWAQESATAAFPATTGAAFQFEFSDDIAFTSPDIYTCNKWVQTGSANGTDAIEARFRVPTKCPRYVRAKVKTSGTTGTITAKFGFEIFG